MKKLTAFIFLLAMTLTVSAQVNWEKPTEEETQRYTLYERKKDIPAKYMQGGVPEADGKVTWTKTYKVEGKSAEDIYNNALGYFSSLVKSENQTEKSALAGVNRAEHKILVRAQEWLVFAKKTLYIDQTKMNYGATVECNDGECKVVITNISYNYEEDRPTAVHFNAEELIADKVAFNKKGNGFTKGGTKKFRMATIDRMEQILNNLGTALK